MRKAIVCGIAAMLVITTIALSRPFFPGLKPIPNFDNVPGTTTECQVCHVNTGGGPPWNLFGETVKANLTGGQPDWSRVWSIDSDGDGFTNGQELLDPSGTWQIGQANPGIPSAVTHPGDPSSRPVSSVKSVKVPTAWAAIKALFR